MHSFKVSARSSEIIFDITEKTNTNHQFHIEVQITGTVDSGSELTIYGLPFGGTQYIELGTIDLVNCPDLKLFDGAYIKFKLTPNSTFINDTDNPTYTAAYTGWR